MFVLLRYINHVDINVKSFFVCFSLILFNNKKLAHNYFNLTMTKPTPAQIKLEAIYTLDEVWGRDQYKLLHNHSISLFTSPYYLLDMQYYIR